MLHLNARPGRRKAHFDFFLQLRKRLDRFAGHHTSWLNLNLYRDIVRGPRRDRILRSFPHAVSATELKLFFAALSQLLRILFEQILPAYECEPDNPRSDSTG